MFVNILLMQDDKRNIYNGMLVNILMHYGKRKDIYNRIFFFLNIRIYKVVKAKRAVTTGSCKCWLPFHTVRAYFQTNWQPLGDVVSIIQIIFIFHNIFQHSFQAGSSWEPVKISLTERIKTHDNPGWQTGVLATVLI